ncbi:hypothetical protein ACVWZ6_001159 [Bradyrhizobium sp. GM6.1]
MLGDVGAVEQNAAARCAELAGDQVEISGLAGAVRADDRGEFARAEAASDAVDRDMAAEADGEVAGFEGQRHGGSGK